MPGKIHITEAKQLHLDLVTKEQIRKSVNAVDNALLNCRDLVIPINKDNLEAGVVRLVTDRFTGDRRVIVDANLKGYAAQTYAAGRIHGILNVLAHCINADESNAYSSNRNVVVTDEVAELILAVP